MDSEDARGRVEDWLDTLGWGGAFFCSRLEGGFTGDVLWLVESAEGAFPPFVARFFEPERLSRFEQVYRVLERCEAVDFPANRPLLLEIPEDGDDGGEAEWCGIAYTFIPGQSLGRTLLHHEAKIAGDLGWEAGKLLHRFHQLELETPPVRDAVRKTILKYERYQEAAYGMQLRFAGQDVVESFIEEHLAAMPTWPVVLCHDDFHPRNLIEQDTRIVGVIDFDRMEADDPVQDLRKIPWFTLPLSEAFASAELQAFAEQAPVPDLWRRYNLYVAMSLVSSLVWQARRDEPDGMALFQQRVMEIVNTHDFVDAGPPSWFRER